MEDWEKELREKLKNELPEGAYDISSPGFTCWTGKLGYIDFEIELRKQLKNFKFDDNAKNI